MEARKYINDRSIYGIFLYLSSFTIECQQTRLHVEIDVNLESRYKNERHNYFQ
jgi:hypothetical protein